LKAILSAAVIFFSGDLFGSLVTEEISYISEKYLNALTNSSRAGDDFGSLSFRMLIKVTHSSILGTFSIGAAGAKIELQTSPDYNP
jgi:hypothetical protein